MTNYNPNSMDAALARIEQKLDDALDKQAKHENAIEDLKKWRWFSSGIGAAVGSLIGWVSHK